MATRDIGTCCCGGVGTGCCGLLDGSGFFTRPITATFSGPCFNASYACDLIHLFPGDAYYCALACGNGSDGMTPHGIRVVVGCFLNSWYIQISSGVVFGELNCVDANASCYRGSNTLFNTYIPPDEVSCDPFYVLWNNTIPMQGPTVDASPDCPDCCDVVSLLGAFFQSVELT